MTQSPDFGALVISLDFELHWGVRDHFSADGPYRPNLLGARKAIPEMLDLFQEFDVAATWATVGFLFARSKSELESFSPSLKPRYANARLSPYGEPVGEDEDDDPLHYAPSLIELIRGCRRQEIGTHTFSHYYCLEPGQDSSAFEADLTAANAIAEVNRISLRSIAIPRNQINPAYLNLLSKTGMQCYRGNQPAWMYPSANRRATSVLDRGARLADAYLPIAGLHVTPWSAVPQSGGLCNVPASLFLRPCGPAGLERLRMRRIALGLRKAAATRSIFHLWWHPHNFGVRTRENLSFLRTILREFARVRDQHGMRSLSMGEVTDHVPRSALAS